MIYLAQNEINSITVSNSTEGDNPYFTWKLVRKGYGQEVIFTSDNLSSVPWYFSTFSIELTPTASNVGLTAGIIQLDPGEYDYYIYAYSTPYNLTPTGNPVQVGIVQVTGSFSQIAQNTNLDRVIKYNRNL